MSSGLRLTTTSYAVLGLLATRSWTTYELAKQMGRSVGWLWPRAQSKIYEEPKKLVALGLARGTEERLGRRRRTVYAITPKGRAALAAWLAEPGAGPALEFEAMLKVFFAENGSKSDLLARLAEIRRWSEERMGEHVAVARSYLQGEGPFPERAAVLALTGRFVTDLTELVGTWADWATGVVEQWPDDPRAAEPHWDTFKEYARRGLT